MVFGGFGTRAFDRKEQTLGSIGGKANTSESLEAERCTENVLIGIIVK